MYILMFGDSITEGLWDSKGGWADRLKSYINKNEIENGFKDYHEAYNLGIDGNTTSQILERFDGETKARLWPDSEYVFIIAAGINDTLHRGYEDFESTPEQYAHGLHQLVQKAKQYSGKIIFVDITPVDEALTNPVASSSTGKCYTNDRIDLFNDTLRCFCQEQSLACVEVSKAFKAERHHSLLSADGLHPNDAGHELIYNLVKPNLEEWL